MAAQAEKNPVSQLNEYCVKNGYPLAEWRELAKTGPPHLPVFVYEVSVRRGNQDPDRRSGTGTSKQQAKTEAAKAMMSGLPQPHSLPVVPPVPQSAPAASDAATPDVVKPKKKPPCFHYKKILAHMKARRDGDLEELRSSDTGPSFDSKKALAQIAAFWGFTYRYQTYQLDAESPFEAGRGPVLRVCIVSFQHARLERLRQLQDSVIRPEVFCQGQGKTVDEADEDCAGRALKYLACMNDKLDTAA